MLKGFHLAPSLKMFTQTQSTINRKEKNFIRPNQVHPHGSRTIGRNGLKSLDIHQFFSLTAYIFGVGYASNKAWSTGCDVSLRPYQ